MWENGEMVLPAIRVAGGESAAAWQGVVEIPASRGVRAPALSLIRDGAALRAATSPVTYPHSRPAVHFCS